ncbi:MAG: tetratricopeptide domain-containing protein [Candidatus Peregrinibacteria bacterium GW2011_GWC2_39_14]|nr:MAG: tetratricopeptide domain-containing protein [Candidatus Peregrinibacteria bacterium GW2011_GWC2_39_14]
MLKKNKKWILPAILIVGFGLNLAYIFKIPPFRDNDAGIQIQTFRVAQPQNTKPIQTPLINTSKSVYESYNSLMKEGNTLNSKGRFAFAINSYRKAANTMPGSIDPVMKIGTIYLTQKDPAKARETFEEVLHMGSNDFEAKLNIGRTYLMEGNIGEASKSFEQLDPKEEIVAYYEGIIAIYLGEYEKGKTLLATINTDAKLKGKAQGFLNAFAEFSKFEGGQISHLKTLIAKALISAEENTMATQLLSDVIKSKKDYRDAWILLGYAYLNNNNASDASQALEEAKKLDPAKAETLFFLGLSYFAENKIDNAIVHLEAAIQKGFEPKIQAHQKLAELYFLKKDYEKSAKAYETVLGINSGNVDYFVRPIWIYIEKLNNPKAALELAKLALKAHPNSAMAYNLLGWANIVNKDYKSAKQNLDKALALAPSMSAIYLNFGQLYEEMEYPLTAKDYYKKAFTLDKNTTSIATTAAEKYNKLEKKTYQANSFNR